MKRNFFLIVIGLLVSSRFLNSANNEKFVNYEKVINNKRVLFYNLPIEFDYSAVRCIFKDYEGYMWFATSEGLVKYNGVNLTVYRNEDPKKFLSNNLVTSIVEDKYKNLWVSTFRGLNVYDRNNDNFIIGGDFEKSLKVLDNVIINCLSILDDKYLLIGTHLDGMYVYDLDEKRVIIKFFNEQNEYTSLISNIVKCIFADKNRVFIGTNKGLSIINSNNFYNKKFFNPKELKDIDINDITKDDLGNIWIATLGHGLFKLKVLDDLKYEIEKISYNKNFKGYSGKYLLSLFYDKNGFLWIGTENEGLIRFDLKNNQFALFKHEEGNIYSINSNSIWYIYGDDENRIWFATYNKGINVIDENIKKFEVVKRNNFSIQSLTDNNVMGFAEDNQGNIWVATDGGGICEFDLYSREFKRKIVKENNNGSIINNSVQCIIYDKKHNEIWVGTWAGGVDRFSGNGKKIKNYSIGKNNIFTLFKDRNDNIWVGTAGSGLYRFDRNKDKFYKIVCLNDSASISSTTYVTSIIQSSENEFWVSTLYGLSNLRILKNDSCYCTNYFNNPNNPNTLSSNMIDVIYKDSKGNIWIGTTDKGLNILKLNTKEITRYNENDGLPSNSIKGILEDKNGNIWISTSHGISKFIPERNIFINYTKEDGLVSNKYNVRACLVASNGEFLFGSKDGFVIFNPDSIKINKYVPKIYIVDFKINNKSINHYDKGSPLKKHISKTDTIILKYNQSSFSIEFIALNYTHSQKNKFAYILEGFDKQWNYVGTNRIATYTNISPGKYIFKVKGANNDNIWNDNPALLHIIIKPPFWKTNIAYVLYFIFITLVSFIAYRIVRERIRIINQLKLEKMAREKEHELNEKNIQFFTNVAHEFKTPLSLVLLPLEQLMNSVSGENKDILRIAYRNALRLQHLSNNLMNFRKLEEGILKLKIQEQDIIILIKNTISYFKLNARLHNIDFQLESEYSSYLCWFDFEKLETIIYNLLSNSFKFTPDGGKIKVKVDIVKYEQIKESFDENINEEYENFSYKYALISVIDNGCGIPSEDLPYIFEKYFRSKSSVSSSGTGIGLTLVKGLVEMHKGKIYVYSKPNIETCFQFFIPISKEAYSEEFIFTEEKKNNLSEVITDFMEEIPINHELNKYNLVENYMDSNYDNESIEVLIVEDDDQLREYLCQELGKYFKVIIADNGKKGLECALNYMPDIIVSDILMPESSGFELCKKLKTEINTSHIPIIMLSAKTNLDDQIKAIEYGADFYITKPFSVKYLITVIKQIIQTRRKLYASLNQNIYLIPGELTSSDIDKKFMQKIVDFIINNLTNDALDVDDIANYMGMSRSNLYRKIKALTGKSIVEFIKIIRLKHALKLLETRKYSIAEIAYQTGFNSPAYFTKCFKEFYGKTPSEYIGEK